MKSSYRSNIYSRQILLAISLVFLLTMTSTAQGENPAERFFENSDVRVNYEEENFVLKLDTPIPVLCAVNFGLYGENYDNLTAMNMISPAQDHDIRLEMKAGQQYRVVLTAFTRDHKIFRSRVYRISTKTPTEGENLVEDSSGKARVMNPEAGEKGFLSQPEVTDIGSSNLKISFTSKTDTLASTALGETKQFGRLIRRPNTNPFRGHEINVLGLEPAREYFTETILIDNRGNLYRSNTETFSTLEQKGQTDYGTNWASLDSGASVKAVSSNWGNNPDGTFGAKNAIDGDPGTEWSSQSEGNDAWIEIELPERINITAIGFWTRTMGSTGQISKIRVTTGKGKIIGEFLIPSATELHDYSVTPTSADQVRFEVVESTGGNTGAREIKVYGTKVE
ncbi:MAG: discoidin domain-containing protein [Candidatus Bipolaricaulota bacterium]